MSLVGRFICFYARKKRLTWMEICILRNERGLRNKPLERK